MHNALYISEIFDCVVDHLKEDAARRSNFGVNAKDTRRINRLALAALARTCRTFSEPALDALWYRLDSLEPFMQIRISVDDSDSVEDEGLLPVFHEEWNIVSRYASRVRELKVDPEETDIDQRLLHNFMQSLWFRSMPLLPNLNKLFWRYNEIAPIRLLLGPSLVHLYVWLAEDNDSVMAFLECYHILCPNLKSLYIGHHYYANHPARFAISRAISHSPNLTAVLCGFIDRSTLTHFANSPHLKQFRAVLPENEPDTLTRLVACRDPNHPPFENVRTLELRTRALSSVIPFLKSQQQPFEEVSFHFKLPPTSAELHECFIALGSTTRKKTLRQISLSACREHEMPMDAVDFQVLSLLKIFNLHTFGLYLFNPVTLTDDELGCLVEAWPDLEVFHLEQQRAWKTIRDIPGIRLTLRGLLVIAKRCPRMRDLGLFLDARSAPFPSDDESPISNTTITRLSLAYSHIQRSAVKRVAQFLLEHFPVALLQPPDCGSIWNSVAKLVEEGGDRKLQPEESDGEDSFRFEFESESESEYEQS